jgi:hypothetical protein
MFMGSVSLGSMLAFWQLTPTAFAALQSGATDTPSP